MKPKHLKRREAEERNLLHNSLSLEQKIQKARRRPGNSTKELSRLYALMVEEFLKIMTPGERSGKAK